MKKKQDYLILVIGFLFIITVSLITFRSFKKEPTPLTRVISQEVTTSETINNYIKEYPYPTLFLIYNPDTAEGIAFKKALKEQSMPNINSVQLTYKDPIAKTLRKDYSIHTLPFLIWTVHGKTYTLKDPYRFNENISYTSIKALNAEIQRTLKKQ